MERVADTKAIKHAAALETLYQTLHSGGDDACYGPAQVEFAAEHHAIKTLLVTDQLFRASDVPTRQKYAQLAEGVRESGGQVLVFSDMHISGQQLQQLSGIAALLHYPLPELETLPVDKPAES